MSNDVKLIEAARSKAEEVLRSNARSIGLLSARTAYQQVNGRDAMICGLGLMLLDEPFFHDVHRRSLESLAAGQSRLGNIPFGVGFPNTPDESFIATGGTFAPGKHGNGHRPVVDTLHAGCVDNCLWYIIGHYVYYQRTKDLDFLMRFWHSLNKAYLWLQYQDVNECGLLEVHEAMDWADLFANRYNVLYDNVLWCAVHRAMGVFASNLGEDASCYFNEAQSSRFKLNLLLWVGPEVERNLDWIQEHRAEWLYPVKRTSTELVVRPYYLPYVAFRDYADRFDTLGNLLAILTGVTVPDQTARILDYIYGVGLDNPYPIRVLYPVIRPGEQDWRHYYLVRNLNKPYHYHNGGIWPFVGGFYVATLVKAGKSSEAERQLAKLAELNSLGRKEVWEFNEWIHGESGRPMGFSGQSWSAAMYIYAYETVKRGTAPFFWPNMDFNANASETAAGERKAIY